MNYPATPSDFFNFPSDVKADVQVFNCINSTSSFQQWIKPRGTTMAYMVAIGGGGGGGAATRGGNGPGGGGSGAISRLLVPTFFIPDTLYVYVGNGGVPVTAGTAANGTFSAVMYAPTYLLTQNVLLLANGGTGGTNGGSPDQPTGNGGAGAAASLPFLHSGLGLFFSVAGQAGSDGSASNTKNTPPNVNAWGSIPISGGGGGAQNNALIAVSGGSVVANQIQWPNMNYSVSASIAAGGAANGSFPGTRSGSGGVRYLKPFLTSGGGGGATTVTQSDPGGNGGIAQIGSGGGGGSSPNGGGNGTPGTGGRGGDGMVVIISW